jgi:curved DNA-binding protein
MAGRDLYAILGVPRSASEQEIRKAYRALARKLHPDRNPGNKEAEDKFKDASYASEVLLNKDKRKLYDEFGEQGLREGFNAEAYRQYQQRASSGAGSGGFGGFGSGGLEDLFGRMNNNPGGGNRGNWGAAFQDFLGDEVETILGGRGRRGRPRGRELISELTIDFMDAVRGAEHELSLQSSTGGPPRTIKVRIPAGVRDGGRIRLRGQGDEGGDLVLHVHVSEHPVFKREHDNLLLNLPVTVGEAFRGTKVQVPTPDGPVTMQLPKGVKSGAKLRLKGRGVRRGTEAAGDLFAIVQIVLPNVSAASPELDAAVTEIEKHYGESPRKDLES